MNLGDNGDSYHDEIVIVEERGGKTVYYKKINDYFKLLIHEFVPKAVSLDPGSTNKRIIDSHC